MCVFEFKLGGAFLASSGTASSICTHPCCRECAHPTEQHKFCARYPAAAKHVGLFDRVHRWVEVYGDFRVLHFWGRFLSCGHGAALCCCPDAAGYRISADWLAQPYGYLYVSYAAAEDSVYVHWWDEVAGRNTMAAARLKAGQSWVAVSGWMTGRQRSLLYLGMQRVLRVVHRTDCP